MLQIFIATLPIIAGVLLIVIEILFDKRCWAKEIPDKPASTILRAGILIVFGAVVWIVTKDFMVAVTATLATGAVFFALFDFTLNIVQWEWLPQPYYKPYHSTFRTFRKKGEGVAFSKVMAWQGLTNWEKFIFKFSNFTKRFFWHGDKETKSWYDLFFQKVSPPPMEILIKVSAVFVAWYYYI